MPTSKKSTAEQLAEHLNAMRIYKREIAYVDSLFISPLDADQRMGRLYFVTGCTCPEELAAYLHVNTDAIAKAEESGKIPSDWLLFILTVENILPQWILTGKGSVYAESINEEQNINFRTRHDRQEDKKALKSLSSHTLAEELLRRIALKQQEDLLA